MKVIVSYEFDDEESARAHLGGTTRAALTAAPVTAVEPAEEPGVATTATIDGDGMPYDAAIHSDPPSLSAGGLWRAKRGKAQEADSARAAFKARGGTVTAPVVATTVAPAMPGMTAGPVVMPGLPVAAPPPITFERLIEKINGMLARAVITGEAFGPLYAKHGVTNPAVFETNESLRAALFGDLCQIEPELS